MYDVQKMIYEEVFLWDISRFICDKEDGYFDHLAKYQHPENKEFFSDVLMNNNDFAKLSGVSNEKKIH